MSGESKGVTSWWGQDSSRKKGIPVTSLTRKWDVNNLFIPGMLWELILFYSIGAGKVINSCLSSFSFSRCNNKLLPQGLFQDNGH